MRRGMKEAHQARGGRVAHDVKRQGASYSGTRSYALGNRATLVIGLGRPWTWCVTCRLANRPDVQAATELSICEDAEDAAAENGAEDSELGMYSHAKERVQSCGSAMASDRDMKDR